VDFVVSEEIFGLITGIGLGEEGFAALKEKCFTTDTTDLHKLFYRNARKESAMFTKDL
jgi:hypothetical protein